jgi:hypothetical protein
MRWSWRLKPSGPLRFLTPLVARVGRRQMRAIWTGLERVLEDPTTKLGRGSLSWSPCRSHTSLRMCWYFAHGICAG